MTFYADNGILAKIPGDLIARGSKTLPPAGAGQPEKMSVELDVGHLGRVRIAYRLTSSRRGKFHNWFWTASFAEVV